MRSRIGMIASLGGAAALAALFTAQCASGA
jgi:hypothetical protein